MPLLTEEAYLEHYGILRKSGRYPWGSGRTPYERSGSYLETIKEMRSKGMNETEIARSFSSPESPFTTTDLRALKTIAINQRKQHDINMAQRLKDKGLSNAAIAQRMGLKGESNVRALLEPGTKDKADILEATTNMLRRQVDEKTHIDIGTQVERSLPLSDNPAALIGISRAKLQTAVAMLKEEGYLIRWVKVPQLGANHETNVKVLSKPGSAFPKIEEIKYITDSSTDGGRSYSSMPPLKSISSKRLAVNYKEDGGSEADGLIYLRPGAKDLSLGSARYAQVRIPVDGTHYIKGMAVYKSDLPEGIDVVFNTNKSRSGNKLDALKEMNLTEDGKVNEDNPFGASIKAGGRRGALNILNEEGDWDSWSRSLSAQFLSKQKPVLAETQLKLNSDRRKADLESIRKLTNPTIRKNFLEKFADETDSAAVKLDAAAIPRTAQKVLLPITSLKENEVYAPSFRNGERIVLVRHPHGGPFEIPELTVNNRNAQAKRLLGTSPSDAIGINHKVAERLSGADFDGDFVLAIPNNNHAVKTLPALEGLKDFDPKAAYPAYDGMRTIDGGIYRADTKRVDYQGRAPKGLTKQHEMGSITNLIADMSIHGASSAELAQAVRHSMVVIDSEKHSLDYKASAIDNGIAKLKERYQAEPQGKKGSNVGSSTLITRSNSEIRVPERKQLVRVDKETGKKIYTETGATYVNKKGQTVPKTTISKRMAEVDDAHLLKSSPIGTPIENVYADHANALKAMANEARREAVNTSGIKVSPSAKIAYGKEVASLNAKLNIALKNAPLERQAQVVGHAIVEAERRSNPGLTNADLKKIRARALATARARTGAEKQRIYITPKEWQAIQAGAISNHKLTQILNNSDNDTIRQLATPKEDVLMNPTRQARAAQMLDAGYTQSEVATALGVSLTTLKRSVEAKS